MKREQFYMPMFSVLPLATGRLQTLAQFNVMAGDSLSLDAAGIMRLSPLRRQLVVDPNVEFFGFFVPHRHVYDNWVDFIVEGIDETQTLASFAVPANRILQYLGAECNPNRSYPLHVLAGYNQIWNRYFRVPSDTGQHNGFGERADNFQLSDANGTKYGHPIAHLKNAWNTGIAEQVDDSDREVPISGGVLDVVELGQIRARYGSETARMYFAAADRYKDVLKLAFDTGQVNIDADQRPAVLFHSGEYLGGHDVDGTAEDTLGRFSGKGIMKAQFGFPRRYFPEHGTVYIMAAMRYPLMVYNEAHFLSRRVNPSYKEIACDPRILSAEPPMDVETLMEEMLDSGFSNYDEKIPYGQWFRTMPTALVHSDFEALDGFPFRSVGEFNSYRERHYVASERYDEVFQTTQLGHAQFYGKLAFNVRRCAPSALSSVFAGAK